MNPITSAQNPISQPLKQANPSSHFIPSNPSFQNALSTPTRKPGVFKFPGLKSLFEKFRFRHGLAWAVGLTVEIKMRFFKNVSGVLLTR